MKTKRKKIVTETQQLEKLHTPSAEYQQSGSIPTISVNESFGKGKGWKTSDWTGMLPARDHFNKDTCQVLHLERNSSMHQYKLGASSWETAWQKSPRDPAGDHEPNAVYRYPGLYKE